MLIFNILDLFHNFWIQNYKYCKQLPELLLIVNYISSWEIFGNRKKIFPRLKHIIKRLLP